MRLSKPILLSVFAVALAAYSFDCDGMMTPGQAMQCCNSMPCSSRGHHAQDCCKTMPAMHAPFVQPSPVHGFYYFSFVSAVLPGMGESLGFDLFDRVVAANGHAPPIRYLPASLPLRI